MTGTVPRSGRPRGPRRDNLPAEQQPPGRQSPRTLMERRKDREMSRTRLWMVLACLTLVAGALIAAGCGGGDEDDGDGGGGGGLGLITQGTPSLGTPTPFP